MSGPNGNTSVKLEKERGKTVKTQKSRTENKNVIVKAFSQLKFWCLVGLMLK